MRRCSLVLSVLLLAGCSADLAMPSGAKIRCTSDDECPTPLVCYEIQGVCGAAQGYVSICGNAIVDETEVCDDGNTLSGDGCSSDCMSDEICGNATIDTAAGEACDDGNLTSGDGCQADCVLPSCGDGTTDTGEICDDGNRINGDGCSARCTSNETCGNGVIDVAVDETCDDNNNDSGDGCSSVCGVEMCGNSIVDPGEVCDDNNTISGDNCSADCKSDETCPNGIVDIAKGEGCNDGNSTNGDGCQVGCVLPTCGGGAHRNPPRALSRRAGSAFHSPEISGNHHELAASYKGRRRARPHIIGPNSLAGCVTPCVEYHTWQPT